MGKLVLPSGSLRRGAPEPPRSHLHSGYNFARWSARGGHHARNLETILDRHRQAFEGTSDARIRTGRGAPGRCGIFLHNRVQGRIEALYGGKIRKIRRSSAENSRLRGAARTLAAESSKCGMAGSLRMV
ncbi:MAG: hypothetical protein WA624_23570 [Methylocella sp.]